MSWNLETEKGSEQLKDEKTQFKRDKMPLERKEVMLERERELDYDRAVIQKIEQLRLSEEQNALNKRTKKMLEVGVQQERLDQRVAAQVHQQNELDQGASAQAQQHEKLDHGVAAQAQQQDELDQNPPALGTPLFR